MPQTDFITETPVNPHFALKTVFSHFGHRTNRIANARLSEAYFGNSRGVMKRLMMWKSWTLDAPSGVKLRYLRYVLWNTLLGEAGCVVSPSSQTHYHVDFTLQFAAIQHTPNDSDRSCGWLRDCRPGCILR